MTGPSLEQQRRAALERGDGPEAARLERYIAGEARLRAAIDHRRAQLGPLDALTGQLDDLEAGLEPRLAP